MDRLPTRSHGVQRDSVDASIAGLLVFLAGLAIGMIFEKRWQR